VLLEEHATDASHGLSLAGSPGERVIRVRPELLERERETIGLGERQVGQPEGPDRLGARELHDVVVGAGGDEHL
jgi:hypothetical protein